jgi:lysophospholipase L1-like esterase
LGLDGATFSGRDTSAADGSAADGTAEVNDSPGGTGGTGGMPGGGATGSGGGGPGSGGAVATGGMTGSGGRVGGGGTTSTGGVNGFGGSVATAGTSGTGGLYGTGGRTGTAGQPGTGGTPGTGGQPGTGGTPGTGGRPGTGGTPGTGGRPGTGGSSGTGGSITFNPCPAGTACKILPLGDSITEGFGASGNVGGYRIELFRQTVMASQNITFVGNLNNGPATVEGKTFPKKHEGHGGWTISQISGIADSTLSTNKPDIVLLKIGTNDVNGTGAASAPTNLRNLIDQITIDVPSALLVVSSIIPIMNDTTNQKVKTYNATIPTAVSEAAAAGKHVIFVDSYAAFVADSSWKTKYMTDNLHPNDAGYVVLGQTWYAAISSVLPAP